MKSKLFVPGSRPELFAKALASEADGLSFDLEDAVDEAKKDEARELLGKFLRDLEAVMCDALDMVNLPKPESPDHVRACAVAMDKLDSAGGVGILANIESP